MFNKEMDKILSGRTYSENFIKKNYIDFYNNIIEFNKKSKNISWLNKLYNYINNIHGKTCENCGNSLQFKNRINSANDHCSNPQIPYFCAPYYACCSKSRGWLSYHCGIDRQSYKPAY